MTLIELINRIKLVAQRTASGPIRPLLLNTTALTEVILPRCMDELTEKWSQTPDGLNFLRVQQTVTFVNGEAALPSNIKEQAAETISLVDDPSASLVPSWMEFQLDPAAGNPVDYGRFHIKNKKIYYHARNAAKNTFNGNLDILVITRLSLPNLEGDQVVATDAALQQLITFTAAVVNGMVPLNKLGIDYASLEDVAETAG